ncbi:MAG: Phosphoribosyl-dephospho-CoA transferase [Paracidovorax wautersii]|uniref:Phosphoribosyl-dephospho-CoA transferase n=1 Tax=Paracidovorax wautersii TaxID=1177982 RepID=A0A7V8JPN9_9BURK|nr:MAG: Phosphoribosyl-dephospho-CoA transferase [Paracidovorax wautersii]
MSATKDPRMLPALHRHQLAYLREEGWHRILRRTWDADAQACLTHWSSHGLPLVVTRQRAATAPGPQIVALGLPAPPSWGKRRIALEASAHEVLYFDEFPTAARIAPLLRPAAQPAWQRLCEDLAALQVRVRAQGSHGWQTLTGLAHVRAQSDIDLWIHVLDAAQTAQVDQVLARHAPGLERLDVRLDVELAGPDGAAVTWREWRRWLTGETRQVLIKTLHDARLADAPFGARPQANNLPVLEATP